MRIENTYDHLNALDVLGNRFGKEWEEIQAAIASLDPVALRTHRSKAKRSRGAVQISPPMLNKALEDLLQPLGWRKRIESYVVPATPEEAALLAPHSFEDQKEIARGWGREFTASRKEIDFFKNGVALEAQFAYGSRVPDDLFVKHAFFYGTGAAQVGVELMPSRSMVAEMPSGPVAFERHVGDLVRLGRTSPPCPVLLVSVAP